MSLIETTSLEISATSIDSTDGMCGDRTDRHADAVADDQRPPERPVVQQHRVVDERRMYRCPCSAVPDIEKPLVTRRL